MEIVLNVMSTYKFKIVYNIIFLDVIQFFLGN